MTPVAIEAKVAALRQIHAYPGKPAAVEVIETHMSWIFLVDQEVYKLKKPVRYDRLDFSTLEARRFYCEEELRLNLALAPQVYLGVVPLSLDRAGFLHVDGAGNAVDWLVRMRRLPADLMLDRMLELGTVTQQQLRDAGALLAGFFSKQPPADITAGHYLARLAHEIADSLTRIKQAWGPAALICGRCPSISGRIPPFLFQGEPHDTQHNADDPRQP